MIKVFLLSKAQKIKDDGDIEYCIDGLGVYLNTKNVKRIELLNGNDLKQ